nr:MAG TPA: hypothetical protein [Caudoviricetes sp.]
MYYNIIKLRDNKQGVTYDCYLVSDGIVYKAVCVKVG